MKSFTNQKGYLSNETGIERSNLSWKNTGQSTAYTSTQNQLKVDLGFQPGTDIWKIQISFVVLYFRACLEEKVISTGFVSIVSLLEPSFDLHSIKIGQHGPKSTNHLLDIIKSPISNVI